MSSEAYSEIRGMFQAQRRSHSQKLGSAVAADLAQFGSRRKDLQLAREAVAACADVREYLTAPLKEKIQEGSYKVDIDSFAEKLMKYV